MAETNNLLFTHIKKLVQVHNSHPDRKAGPDQRTCPSIPDAWLWIKDGKIEDFGQMSDLPEVDDVKQVDASGRFILPCWCDSHTHIVYAQSREQEFVHRIRGMSYEEIAEQGGGILNSALALQEMSEDALFDSAWNRVKEVIGFGTGALEIKSGYGLTKDSELKMLRVIRRIKEKAPIPIKSTFLGAHAIPLQYKNNREGYIDLLIDEMLPAVADEQLADYMDVFCDKGFFSPEETDRLLKAGAQYDLTPKIHANELGNTGGIQTGVNNEALSVDHLEHVGDEELKVLQDSKTMATLLPSTAFFLDIEYAPARKLIDGDVPVVLASDYNPGSTPSGRMPFVLSLACIKMNMLPEEAVTAATVNGAHAMELGDTVGSITPGNAANIILTEPVHSLAYLPYAFGSNWIEEVFLNGKAYSDLDL